MNGSEKPRKVCFVISQIGKTGSAERVAADWFLEEIVKPVVSQFDLYEVSRADEIAESGMIDAQIIGRLLDSELVVADLTNLNPNVFYEIGIRHMVQKPIVHMYRAGTEIPFDVSMMRSIEYDIQLAEQMKDARTKLKLAVSQIESSDKVFDNPVTRARGHIEVLEKASDLEKLVFDEMSAIRSDISNIKRRLGSTANYRRDEGSKEGDYVGALNKELVKVLHNDLERYDKYLEDYANSVFMVRSAGRNEALDPKIITEVYDWIDDVMPDQRDHISMDHTGLYIRLRSDPHRAIMINQFLRQLAGRNPSIRVERN